MALALSLGSTFAGDGKSVKEVKEVVEPTCKFRDFELQIDAYYSGFFGSNDSRFRTGSGGGFGINYFFYRYFGVGYEAQWYSNNGSVENLPLAGNFFLRYPICAINLAPYVVVGGGGAWGQGEGIGYGNVGAGLEYRITDHIGLFADGRYFYGGTGNVANLRSGLRIAF